MTCAALRAALQDRGGALAEALAPEDGPEPGGAARAPALAASGPRAAGHEADYELLLEMIMEGSLLHYGAARVLRCEDPDLALLLGDQLYALGLSRLAELGDLDAIAELADLISLVAQAQAAGDAGLVEAVWLAGATAIGWGGSAVLERAKAMARAGGERATAALDAARLAILAGAVTPGV
jgi:hypothetical protein